MHKAEQRIEQNSQMWDDILDNIDSQLEIPKSLVSVALAGNLPLYLNYSITVLLYLSLKGHSFEKLFYCLHTGMYYTDMCHSGICHTDMSHIFRWQTAFVEKLFIWTEDLCSSEDHYIFTRLSIWQWRVLMIQQIC